MSERRVVITGMGVLTPLGCELEVFWQNLLAGRSGIRPVTRFDTTDFDCKIGGEVKDFKPEDFMPIKETRRTDRFTQFAVGAARKAVADSGIDITNLDADRVGVLIGSGIGGMETIVEQLAANLVAAGYEVDIMTASFPGRTCDSYFGARIISLVSGDSART